MDDLDRRRGAGDEAKAPKTKAEDNPWYLLATLYGVPTERDLDLTERNRFAWNHCFAAGLDEKMGDWLIQEKRFSPEELRPIFAPEQDPEIAKAFAQRSEGRFQVQDIAHPGTQIVLSNVEFDCNVDFTGYLFTRFFSVNDARFSAFAGFRNAVFTNGVEFQRAAFDMAHFDNAIFCGMATFEKATFSGWTNFKGSKFISNVYFNRTKFLGLTDFPVATFSERSSFDNAIMNGRTSFEDAIFRTTPPEFFDAKLHQGTVWRGITWPTPKKTGEAGSFIDAYACLKLEMDRLKKHEDELDFFALELQSRRVLQEGKIRGSGLPIQVYGLVSDFGRSYARPLYWLAATIAAAAWVFRECGSLSILDAYGLSLANTFGIFGFHNYFADPIIKKLPAALKILAGLQTILGATLLFLFGLGVRNKFRMK